MTAEDVLGRVDDAVVGHILSADEHDRFHTWCGISVRADVDFRTAGGEPVALIAEQVPLDRVACRKCALRDEVWRLERLR